MQSPVDQRPGSRRVGWVRWSLAAVMLLVAANAVYGGIGLMLDGLGMPSEWLAATPFDSWVLPGLALLITVALPQLAVSGMVVAGHRWAPVAGLAAGVALVGWILVELLVLQHYSFLQPLVAGFGLVEMALAGWWLAATRVAPIR